MRNNIELSDILVLALIGFGFLGFQHAYSVVASTLASFDGLIGFIVGVATATTGIVFLKIGLALAGDSNE